MYGKFHSVKMQVCLIWKQQTLVSCNYPSIKVALLSKCRIVRKISTSPKTEKSSYISQSCLILLCVVIIYTHESPAGASMTLTLGGAGLLLCS